VNPDTGADLCFPMRRAVAMLVDENDRAARDRLTKTLLNDQGEN